jgi:threonine dehydratase
MKAASMFADGLACRELNEQALAVIWGGAARVLRLSEDETAEAVRVFYTCTYNVAEAAGAAPLAGLIREQARYKDKRAAGICSGGNIDAAFLAEILSGPTPGA